MHVEPNKHIICLRDVLSVETWYYPNSDISQGRRYTNVDSQRSLRSISINCQTQPKIFLKILEISNNSNPFETNLRQETDFSVNGVFKFTFSLPVFLIRFLILAWYEPHILYTFVCYKKKPVNFQSLLRANKNFTAGSSLDTLTLIPCGSSKRNNNMLTGITEWASIRSFLKEYLFWKNTFYKVFKNIKAKNRWNLWII